MKPAEFIRSSEAEAREYLTSRGTPQASLRAANACLRGLIDRLGTEFDLDGFVDRLAYSVNPNKTLGYIERFVDAAEGRGGADWSAVSDHFPIWMVSNFLSNRLAKHPEWAEDRLAKDWRGIRNRERYEKELKSRTRKIEEEAELAQTLRRFKYREYLRLTLLDLESLQPMNEIVWQISDLADASLEAALEWHWKRALKKYGLDVRVACPLCVIGMGKLGGQELNYSSDIDILFLYDRKRVPEAMAERSERVLEELAQQVTNSLHESTADGIVFRVDTRLRPGGNQAPLAQSVEMAVDYFLNWGRTWERGALIKARACAGRNEVGQRFFDELQPFIYRRYLDFATLEDIREMKDKIDANASGTQSGQAGWDVKLGKGGIREIEFCVQSLQLIHAGRRSSLRSRRSLESLEALRAEGLMRSEAIDELSKAYLFHRHLEHRLMMIDERQTQWLPDAGEERAIAFRAMPHVALGEDAERAVSNRLNRHRDAVQYRFNSAFREAAGSTEDPKKAESPTEGREKPLPECIERLDAPGERWDCSLEEIERAGFSDPKQAAANIANIRHRFDFTHLPQRSLRDLRALAPMFVKAAARSANPDQALRFIDNFLEGLAGNAHFYALLRQNPKLVDFLTELFASSAYLTRFFLQHPELLDSMVMGGYRQTRKSRRELERIVTDLRKDARDYEDAMLLLRKFRNEETLRIGLADLAGDLDILEANEELSLLAETCLREALGLAADELHRRYRPNGVAGDPLEGLAIFAMGKLGGVEMSYSSDLDLIFVYDEKADLGSSRPPKYADSAVGVSPDEYYSRLMQKLITTLTAQMREGRLYEVDTRLRPSGSQGPLVVGLQNMIDYHKTQAHTWERQALLKARPVAGSAALGQRLLREHFPGFIYAKSDQIEALAEDMAGMRGRIQSELAGNPSKQYNVKFGSGGLVDIEFAVQFLQLAHGGDRPELRQPNTYRAIGALHKAGVLEEKHFLLLGNAYLFYRRIESRLRMMEDRAIHAIAAEDDRLAYRLARALGFPAKGDQEASQRFLAELSFRFREVRIAYERILKRDPEKEDG